MKDLKNYIFESISKLNPNKSFGHYLIVNFDYNIVYNLLNNHFYEVQKVYQQYPNQKGLDFKCLKEKAKTTESSQQYFGIIYKTIYRKNKEINFEPKELTKDNKINIPKNNLIVDTYIGYILDNKLYLVKKEELESKINNYKVKLLNLKPEYKFELLDEQKDIYQQVYSIYDNITPEDRNSSNFKNLDEFKEINELIK